MDKQHFKALTGLRALAAMAVCAYHYRKFWRPHLAPWFMKFLNELHIGVSIFFVLSGFLIALSYGDKPLKNRGAFSRYMLMRVARIFPVYLAIILYKYLQVGWPGSFEAFLNITLLKGLFDRFNLSGIPQSWSLTTELCFYLAAPYLYSRYQQSIGKAVNALLLIVGASMLTGWGLFKLMGNRNGLLYDFHFLFNDTFPGRCVEFMAGIALAFHVSKAKPLAWLQSIKHQTLLGGLSLIALIYAIAAFEQGDFVSGTHSAPGLLLRNVGVALAAMLFISGLTAERTWFGKLLSTRVLVLLGNSSYAFYLIHIGYVAIHLPKIPHLHDMNLVLTWGVAIGLYLFIEKPVHNLLRKHINPKKVKSMPAPILVTDDAFFADVMEQENKQTQPA